MYDMHYDLLTILYFNLKQNNHKANVDKMLDSLNKMYKNNNIKGGIINLYFSGIDDMYNELGLLEDEIKNVIDMFKKSIIYLNELKQKQIIPNDIDYIYGIEGCDYLNDEHDLETLYELGLRSMIPVWNNENKFGSGYMTDKGLTELGKKLIIKAIDLGIIIDLSHANEKTFFDIIELIKQQQSIGKIVNVIASHSNVKKICDRKRNLTDEQLKSLKDIGGYIGLFINGNFVSSNNKNLSYDERCKCFLEHIKYVIDKIGFDYEKVIISTDDMNFNPDPTYHGLEVVKMENAYKVLYELIKNEYDANIADSILTNNAKKLIHKINNHTA